jgi:putative acyl-CoA dehydrogenase
MTYAVTPALRTNPAIYADWAPQLTRRAYDPALKLWRNKPGVTMGMGMTEKQGGSDVRANTTRAEPEGTDAWGQRFTRHRPQVVLLGADVRRLPGAGADAGRPELPLPARVLPDGSAQRHPHPAPEGQAGQQGQRQFRGRVPRRHAWLVGEEGRGIPQILEMGTMTRLDCALGTSRPDAPGAEHCAEPHAQRQAFGKR